MSNTHLPNSNRLLQRKKCKSGTRKRPPKNEHLFYLLIFGSLYPIAAYLYNINSFTMNSQYAFVKLKNGQRQRKKNNRRDKGYYCLTPPKATCKHSMRYVIPKYCQKYGYDYDAGDSVVLRYAKQGFQQKMIKYLGNTDFARKIGTSEKHRRKQDLNFKIQKNPIAESLAKIRKITRENTIKYAFQAIKSLYNDQK